MPEDADRFWTNELEIRAENISCRRGDFIVLAGLSFVLQPGDCLLLQGPNGAGKTTLLRTLAGLSQIAGGTLILPDEEIAYVGHLCGVNPQFSVYENLRFWEEALGGPVDIATVRGLGLQNLENKPAKHLSVGQLRRLSLASAVALKPRIILLDEPFASLDQAYSSALKQILSRLLSDGRIVVMSSNTGVSLSGMATLNLTPYRCRKFIDTEMFGVQEN